MNPVSKVLIIQTAFLGDAVLVTSLLEKIRIESPETAIHLLVRKGNESIFQAYTHPCLERVWTYDKSNKRASWLDLHTNLKQEYFDKVFVVQRFFGMGLLSLMIGAKQVFGFVKNPLSWFFTKAYPHPFGNGIHEVERNTALLSDWLGEKVFKPFLNPVKMPTPAKNYICISPGSVWETKRLPIQKWIEFIHLLPRNQAVVLMGSPNEKHLSDEIEQACAGWPIYNETGKHALLDSTSIFAQSKGNFVNDSGPMHLSSAVNVPTVALFCSTIPDFGFGPLADQSQIIEVSEKLDCRPCGDHGKKNCPLGHYACGNHISTQKMLLAYEALDASK
jgi:heptosyltransferase-2